MSLLGVQRRGSGPPLVWLHGFTQTKDSAHQFRSILAATHELLTLDLPGHGQNAAILASLPETAELLADVPKLYAAGASYVTAPRLLEAADLLQVVEAHEQNLLEQKQQAQLKQLEQRPEIIP